MNQYLKKNTILQFSCNYKNGIMLFDYLNKNYSLNKVMNSIDYISFNDKLIEKNIYFRKRIKSFVNNVYLFQYIIRYLDINKEEVFEDNDTFQIESYDLFLLSQYLKKYFNDQLYYF